MKPTRRIRLRELLAGNPEGYTLEELMDILDVKRQVVLADLKHLQLSLRHHPESLLMVPPACKDCGYTFKVEEPRAPSKCPSCKSKSLADPVFKVAEA